MVRVFVNSWANYGINGADGGQWISLPMEPSVLVATLDRLAQKLGEADPEWFINDTDSRDFNVHEYDDIFRINELLLLVQEMDSYEQNAVKAFCQFYDTAEAVRKVESGDYVFYSGVTIEELAEEIAETRFEEDDVDAFYYRYFDYDALIRDIIFDGYRETTFGVIQVA